jgi:muramoyltetrapeptide carboxypeptidase
MTTIQPPPHSKPLVISVVALSGATDNDALDCSVVRLQSLGHTVIVEPESRETWRYFSGTDAQRLAGLHRALANPSVDLVLGTRGGYGLSRLMQHIDWPLIAQSKKWLCGFSDFTAINLGALAKSNLITLHGPFATSDFAWESNESVSLQAEHQFTSNSFFAALSGNQQSVDVASSSAQSLNLLSNTTPNAAQPGHTITGTLWGGNLKLVTHLVGTEYMPVNLITNGVLFLEDIQEDPYSIERGLYQLKLAGLLDNQRAIVLGQFNKCTPNNKNRYPYSLDEAIETLQAITTCPIFTNFPFGHVAKKTTLKIGAPCTITTLENGYRWQQ